MGNESPSVDLAGDLRRPESDRGTRIPGHLRAGRQSRHSGSHRSASDSINGSRKAFLALDRGAQERLEGGEVSDQRHGVSRGEVRPSGRVRMQALGLRRDLSMIEPTVARDPGRTSASIDQGKEPMLFPGHVRLELLVNPMQHLADAGRPLVNGHRGQLLTQLVDPTDTGRQVRVFVLCKHPDRLSPFRARSCHVVTSEVDRAHLNHPLGALRAPVPCGPSSACTTTCSPGHAGWLRDS